MADIDVRKTLVEAGYVTVGLGVLGFQRAQVQRRELAREVGAVARAVDRAVAPLRAEVDGRLDQIGRRIGPPGEAVVQAVRASAWAPHDLIRRLAALQGGTP